MIFLILKIIGIILLSLLLILCMLIFLPWHLRFASKIDNLDSDAAGSVSSGIYFFRIKAFYEKELSIRAYIFWGLIKIFDTSGKKKHKKHKNNNKNNKNNSNNKKQNKNNKQTSNGPENKENDSYLDNKNNIEDDGQAPIDKSFVYEKAEDFADSNQKILLEKNLDEKHSAEGRLSEEHSGKENSHNKKKSQNKKEANEDKDDFISKIKKLFEEITDKKNKKAFKKIIKLIKNLFKYLRVKVYNTKLVYSLGEPDLTGLATGIISWIPIVYADGASICPDFTADEPFVRGHIRVKGSIMLLWILILIFKIFTDKDIKKITLKNGG